MTRNSSSRPLSRRRLLGATAAAAGTVAAAPVMAGCSTGSSDKVELDYWLWSANQLPGYSAAIDLFMQENPDIGVRLTQIGWANYWTKLTAGFVAEAGPDVFTNHLGRYAEFVKLGVMQPIEGYGPVDDTDMSRFKSGLQDLWTGEDGKLYGMPKDYDTIAYMYDKKAIADAGVSEDDLKNLDWNPDDGGTFEQMLAHLTVDANGKRGDQKGFDPKNVKTYALAADATIDYVGQTSWASFAFANGWKFTNKDAWGDRFQYDDPKFLETIDWFFGLVDKGYFPPFGTFGGSSPKQAQIQSGVAALAPEGPSILIPYSNLEGVDAGIAPQPTGPVGHPVSIFNGLADSMSAQTKHPEEAARLVAFLGSDKAQSIIGEKMVVLPASDAATDVAKKAFADRGLDISPFTDRVDKEETGPYPLVEHSAEIDTIMKSAFDKLWMRQIEPEDFIAYNDRVNALFE
jgi:multiple sugar transport system substrate-binding protein